MRKLRFERGYERGRQMEYPPLEEFADAYYWLQRGDKGPMEAYLARIDAIKRRFPKKDKA